MKNYTLFYLFILVFNFTVLNTSMGQVTCSSGTVYAVNSGVLTVGATTVPGQRGLFTVDPATEAFTLVEDDLFGGGAAGTMATAGGSAQTSAIALDLFTNIIWYCNRGGGTDPVPRIFSYNITTGVYGAVSGTFSGLSTAQAINKAAFNPIDRRVYFHNGASNRLFRFDPASPSTPAVDLGVLNITGIGSATASFSGGDIAFDGLGNLTGAFSSANVLAIFPATYDASGNYTGLGLVGEQFATLSTGSPASIALLSNGNYLVGAGGGSSLVNSNTGAQTDLGAVNFPSADFASCAAPSPNLVVNKTGTINCTNRTVTYTITIQNTGQFHAIHTVFKDTMPAGVTITSATMNGSPISSPATIGTTGIEIRSTNADDDGQVLKGETVTIVLNSTIASNAGSSIRNQAFVRYNGVESLGLTGDHIASNDPATGASNDATVLAACSVVPVKLISFTVSENSCTARLNWQVATEVLFSHYEVERSTDGIHFTFAGKVNGTHAGNYLFTDNTPLKSGATFYRLRMIDLDHSYELSKIVKAQSNCDNNEVTVFPNPSWSSTQLKGLKGGEVIRVYAANGKLIEQKYPITDVITLDIRQYANGVYNIIVVDKDGNTKSLKLLKIKQ
jgi:uncharacterized repeat protein (TIGR01451 family)